VVLKDVGGFAKVPAMPKGKEQEEAGVWNFREVPRDAIVKAKIGAALEGLSVKAYIIKLVEAHWVEMEKKGILPKGKG
jgi:hypothetical protein